jgi:hypothetical protein
MTITLNTPATGLSQISERRFRRVAVWWTLFWLMFF